MMSGKRMRGISAKKIVRRQLAYSLLPWVFEDPSKPNIVKFMLVQDLSVPRKTAIKS
jgi:hypothetical protein